MIMMTKQLSLQRGPRRAVVQVEVRTKKPCAPGLTIDLEPVLGTYAELSIQCDIRGPGRSRFSGQAREELLAGFGYDPQVARLVEIWSRWHLNGMRAGTRPQQDYLRERPVQAVYPASHYDLSLAALTEAGLNPDRGYKYGQAWLVELLPGEIAKELTELCRSFDAETAEERR